MRVAPEIKLAEDELKSLRRQAQSAVVSRRLSERCRIVLLAAEGRTNEEIGAALQITRQRAGRWRQRYVAQGRAGIEADAPGRGRKPTYPEELRQAVVQKTTRETPPRSHALEPSAHGPGHGSEPPHRGPHLA